MHSRIFEISKKAIKPSEFKESYSYEDHYFVGSIADYVSDSSDRKDDLEWLNSVLSNRFGEFVELDTKSDSFTFKEGFKEEYFRPNFEKFNQIVNGMTLSEFSSLDLEVYKLRMLIADDFSFYFDEDGDMLNMDAFIRGTASAGVKYYIGGTIDYHC